MTEQNPQNTTYRLLKFISRQPIQFSRFIAKALAGLVNALNISKTSETIRLNLQLALPELSEQQREQITAQAIRNELLSYFEFFSIWGSSNQKNLSCLLIIPNLTRPPSFEPVTSLTKTAL